METFGPPSTRHLASGEFVNDDDLTVFNDVVTIALEECMCAQRRLKMSGHERISAVEILNSQHLLNTRNASFGW